jgi:polysaccharide export outer membrane protein
MVKFLTASKGLPLNHSVKILSRFAACAAAVLVIGVSGCATFLPTVGPSRFQVSNAKAPPDVADIQFINIDDTITRQLLGQRKQRLFSETLGSEPAASRVVGAGDNIEVTIWEAAPATLFGTPPPGTSPIATSHATTLPDQPIDGDGTIYVPFAGRVPATGRTLQDIAADITARLEKKANRPEVLVRRTRNLSSNALVVGEVNTSTRVQLVPGNEHLLDALVAAAGVRDPVNKTTIQLTRADKVYSMPLDTIIRDPRQNIALLPGDVITALFQPYSFTALGASGKNDEILFETQGISLAQALARTSGLIDMRSNARGVFIFRFEYKDALAWPREPVRTTADGLVPTIFRIDLTDPESLFLIQNFPMEDRDVLYVSNAPITEIEKFLNVLFSVAYPVLAAKSVGY